MISPRDLEILYLEDDPDSIELVTFTLALDGIQVTAVSTCEEALEMAKSRRFDLYLLDGLLESGYSYQLCEALRRQSPDVPIVFYTALGFPQDVKKGVSAGADGYLIKPFCGNLAETLIRNIAAKKRSSSERVPPVFGSMAQPAVGPA